MSVSRQALLRRRMNTSGLSDDRKRHVSGNAIVIPPRPDPDTACLSAAQQHSWRYGSHHPGSLSDMLGLTFTFDGPVEEGRLLDALRTLVQRHEILRTTYVSNAETGIARQIIHAALPFDYEVLTLSPVEADARTQEALRQPFNLERDGPLRVLMHRTGVTQLRMTLIINHIIWDGATFDLICRELEQLYQGVQLPRLQTQYADWAEWSAREHTHDQAQAYWQAKVGGVLPELSLAECSGDQLAPEEAAERMDITLACGRDLVALATAHKVTPFKAFIACWAYVLWQHSPQEALWLGTTVLNRAAPQIQTTIGNFANHVPLRFQIAGRPVSEQFIPTVSQEIDATFAQSSLPYEHICDLAGCDDSAFAPQLFDSLVVFIPSGTQGPQLPGISCEWKRLHTGATQFPLVPLGLEVFVHGRGQEAVFQVEATYASRRFDQAKIKTLLYNLEAAIKAAAKQQW